MNTIEYLRSFKILNYAIFDFVLSFVGVYLFAPILSKLFAVFGIKITRKSWLFLTVPASIPIHYLVGSITPMTENFLNLNDHYALKIGIIALTYFGLRDITFIKKTKK